jgi:GT2 family glycosyltransferase
MTLFVVVVLYKCAVSESQTCLSLLSQIDSDHRDVFLVYDNSPGSGSCSIPAGWQYCHDEANGGLVRAYNYALSQAKLGGCPWLLLLDQDSRLPPDFLARVRVSMIEMEPNADVVALVPIVVANSRQLSPIIPKLGREKFYDRRRFVESDWVMAINSGTCVRVRFIDDLGGFSADFWLDYLDHWLFRMIAIRGKSVYVTDSVIQHELSVADMNHSMMSVERYQNILTAERRFTNGYLPPLWRLVLVPRLLARAVKHLMLTDDKRLAGCMANAALVQLASMLKGPRSMPGNR